MVSSGLGKVLALLCSVAVAWVDQDGQHHSYFLRPSQAYFDKLGIPNPGPRVTFNITGAIEKAARTPCRVCNRTGSFTVPCGDHCVDHRMHCNQPRAFGCAIMHPAKKCTCNPFGGSAVSHTRCAFATEQYHLPTVKQQDSMHERYQLGVAGTVIRVEHAIDERIAWHATGTHHTCATRMNDFGVRECHCCNCYDTPAHPEYGSKLRTVDTCQHHSVFDKSGLYHVRPTTAARAHIAHCHRGWLLAAVVHVADKDDVAQPATWFQAGHNRDPLEKGNAHEFLRNQEPSSYGADWLQGYFDSNAARGQRVIGRFVLHNGKLPNITRTYYKELNNKNWPKLFAGDDTPTNVCRDAALTKECRMGTITAKEGRVRLQHMGSALNYDGEEPLYYASGIETDHNDYDGWPYNYRDDENDEVSWGHGLHLWISAM